MCVLGILLALQTRHSTQKGSFVDVSMAEGTAYLASFPLIMRSMGWWNASPGTNLLDGGAHFYGCYKTKDGGFIAV